MFLYLKIIFSTCVGYSIDNQWFAAYACCIKCAGICSKLLNSKRLGLACCFDVELFG